MPTLVFDGIIENLASQSLDFEANGFLYFVVAGVKPINVQLDLALPDASTRIVPICPTTRDCARISRVWSDEIIQIPCSLVGSGLQLRLTLSSFGSSFAAQVYHIANAQPTLEEIKDQLDTIEIKINELYATQIFKLAIDLVVPLLTGGVSSLILPAAGSALRGGFELLNPSSEPVYIGLQDSVSITDYDRILPPGASLSVDGWQGEVSAIAPNGGDVQLQLTEFRAE